MIDTTRDLIVPGTISQGLDVDVNSSPTIVLQRLSPSVKFPTQGTPGSLGWDLYAHILDENGNANKIILPPNNVRAIPTGLRIRALSGALVLSRSGLAKELSVFVANAPGIIDPDYRGDLVVLLYNGGFQAYHIHHGHRIAQLCLPSFSLFTPGEVENIDPDTLRGGAGMGSTGR